MDLASLCVSPVMAKGRSCAPPSVPDTLPKKNAKVAGVAWGRYGGAPVSEGAHSSRPHEEGGWSHTLASGQQGKIPLWLRQYHRHRKE